MGDGVKIKRDLGELFWKACGVQSYTDIIRIRVDGSLSALWGIVHYAMIVAAEQECASTLGWYCCFQASSLLGC